jgi:hypothetical protein
VTLARATTHAYTRWHSKEGNVWCKDKGFLPCWSHIDCVMTTWTSKIYSKTIDSKMRILAKQISIIMASSEAYKS